MSGESSQYTPGLIANLALSPQQKSARLVRAVMADLSYTKEGKLFNADDIEEDDGEVAVTTRIPPTPDGEAQHKRRVGFFQAKARGVWLEDLERVRMLEDPASAVMQSIMAGKNRATDDAIIAALKASAREGETGETTVTFPAAQTIAVDNRAFLHQAEVVAGSGNLPLTIGKLIKTKVQLDQSEIEGERFFAAGSVQLGNLLQSIPVTNGDYARVEKLVAGEVDNFMGFTFVRTERLPVASSIRSCFGWIKQAMIYKERPIHTARVTQRADKSFRWQAYYELERGALRRYDTGVVEVLCTEA